MTISTKKPFYKNISFIVCVTLLSMFAVIAIAMFVLMAMRYNIYRNAVDAVNAAITSQVETLNAMTGGAPTNPTFEVMLNGNKLQYWTKNIAAAVGNQGVQYWSGEYYYLTDKFYLSDFAQFNGTKWVSHLIDASDNEIWVYLTKPLAGNEIGNTGSLISFKNLHGQIENLSFLPSALNGGTTQQNIIYIACAVTFSVGTFVALVPVLFMTLAPKFANKQDKKAPNTQEVQLQQNNQN